MPTITASVVQVHDTRQYGSGDPSGLAYIPGQNALFIADSEHDESPYFSSTNLFAVGPDGTFIRSYSLTSFTSEPSGLGYNATNGYLYITDDDQQEVFWVNPAHPSVKIGQFDTSRYGLTDTEDPKFDPVTSHMFLLDGVARKLFEFTVQGSVVSSMALPSVMGDAEALAYDPSDDVFFVASGASPTIWEMSRSGQILATIDVLSSNSYRNPVSGAAPAPKGLELAPSSIPTDGNTMSLFVADYGVDQQNDGRLFEISLGSGWLVGGPAPTGAVMSGNDVIVGGPGPDRLYGYAGKDFLRGRAGNDSLDGGTGSDVLLGESGNDVLLGRDGDDRLDGGLGHDRLYGLNGNDLLLAREGSDFADGGTGSDTVLGYAGDDALLGRDGNDRLDGGLGHDRLYGLSGNDLLRGDAGRDVMSGGAGYDRFVFTSVSNSRPTVRDTITDFAHGDKINLSLIDANTRWSGNQAFHLVSGFTGAAGELTAAKTSWGFLVSADVNGDGRADFALSVKTALAALHSYDFVL